ncbi:MAG: hypothetical protein CSA44_02785 [Gammaproteobacteria bacterium]|nr:MAG: hypothetical protein CSA44_02785 [Gammaproteobacteria bacterium]
MRNRIVGGVAFVLGLLYLFTIVMLLEDREAAETKIWTALICFALYFLLVGAWQLFTGKGVTSMIIFIISGKITKDNSNTHSEK